MSSRFLLGRRQFLISSSACAVAAATLGPSLFAAEGNPKRLAVGYALFEDGAALRSAASISSADGGFIGHGARISVWGAAGLAADPRQRRTVELIAHYPYFDGAERKVTPFRAWGASRLTGEQGNPTRFTVPVDEVQKISFVVGAETGAPGAVASRRDAFIDPTQNTPLPLELSLQNEPGTLRLARGFYVVVPLFENDAEPRWYGLAMRETGGRWELVDGDGKAAAFEHFILQIDYAS